ncbi:hypothetical protein AB6A40_009237, partial [Gnathostoma spinigerum]
MYLSTPIVDHCLMLTRCIVTFVIMKCSSLLLYFVVVFTTNNPLRYLISSTQSSTQRTELGNATVFSFRRSTPSTVNEVHKVLSSTNDDESGNSE